MVGPQDSELHAMPINADTIRRGHCYATAAGDVRKIIEVLPYFVIYVSRGKLAFPTWDKRKWRSVSPEVFAREVVHEVPCDWQGG